MSAVQCRRWSLGIPKAGETPPKSPRRNNPRKNFRIPPLCWALGLGKREEPGKEQARQSANRTCGLCPAPQVMSKEELKRVLTNKLRTKDALNDELRRLHASLGTAGTSSHIITANMERKKALIMTITQDVTTLMQLIGKRDKQKNALKF